ncbi:B12-binding domain-containing radical SAM protein [Acidobacteriota bacterium]
MARIALVSLYDFKSLGIRQVHAILKQQGHQPVSIFFKESRLDRMTTPTEKEYELFYGLLEDTPFLFVGLSLRSTFAPVGKKVSDKLMADGHLVIWGGTHATVAPEDAIDHAHAVCVGEGEDLILEVIERLQARKDLNGLSNLWVRDNGQVHKTEMRPLKEDLDALPAPWWEPEDCYYIENGKLSEALPPGAMTSYDIMTSRGCFYRCAYCIHSILFDQCRDLGKYVRRRSPESVIAELEDVLKLFPSVSRIRFWDDTFTFNLNWIERFTSAYRESIRLPFFCYTTPAMGKPKVLSLLKTAGLNYISMGIQSGSERIRRDIYDRPVPDKAIINAAGVFNDLKLFPEYDLIIDNPFETESDFAKSLDLLLKLPRPFKLNQHSLTYFPNYKISEKALAAGYIEEEDLEHVRSKALTRWHEVFDTAREPESVFWSNLYYLTQFKLIPRWLIRLMARSRLLRVKARHFNALLKFPGQMCERGRTVLFYIKERGMIRAFTGVCRKILRHIRYRLNGNRHPTP